MSAPPQDAAVALGGEAFTVLTVLFVLGMLLVVLLRARAKARAARGPKRRRHAPSRSDGGDAGAGPMVSDTGGKRADPDGPGGDAGDGGGDGGGGGGGGD